MLSRRLCGASHIRDAQTEVAVDENHFTAGDDLVSNHEIHRIRNVPIQFHDVARAEFKNFSKRHLAAAKSQRSL